MNKKSFVLLIILVLVLLLLSFLWVFRDELFVSSLITEEKSNNKNNSIEIIDNSEKIAKLYNFANNKEYIKEISENEIDKILEMLKTNEIIPARISFSSPPNYLIEYNSNIYETIGFRIQSECILAVVNTSQVYNIYKENDVSELLRILNTTLKGNLQFNELDISKTYSPPKIYDSTMHNTILGSYIWKNEKGDMIAADVGIKFKEMLKNEIPFSSFVGLVVSLDTLDESNLIKLPSTAKITYNIYKDEESVLEKEAERMLNGSYHLETPNIKGEYIYELNLTFEDIPNIHALYYFKYSI